MLSPGFVDFLILLLLVIFIAKGYITGFIRSVVTLVAVIAALAASAAMPTLLASILGHTFPATSPNFLVVNRLASFILFFATAQGVGFLATGLLEKIGLGDMDKLVGLLLGIIAGVIVGSMPGIAIYGSSAAMANPGHQRYLKASFFTRTYMPVIKLLAKPAKPKRHPA